MRRPYTLANRLSRPARDVEEAVGVAVSEVAGAQLAVLGVAERELVGRARVAEHHVGPAVDELAGRERLAQRVAR